MAIQEIPIAVGRQRDGAQQDDEWGGKQASMNGPRRVPALGRVVFHLTTMITLTMSLKGKFFIVFLPFSIITMASQVKCVPGEECSQKRQTD